MPSSVRVFCVALVLLFLAHASPAQFTPFVPAVCGVAPFTDVTDLNDPFCAWIQQFKNDKITAGCANGKYCPDAPVTHRQVSVLLERAMRGTQTWDPAQGVYKRTVVIHPVPGDDILSGKRLLDGLAAIADNTYLNPYLLKIEPGQYNLNGDSLVKKAYVDIEGSGQSVTSVYSNTSAGTIQANDGEIRFLYISASGTGAVALAVDGIVTMRASTLLVSAAGNIATVVVSGNATLTVFDSSISASGSGSFVQGIGVFDNATLRLHDSYVSAWALSGGGAQALPVNTWSEADVYQSTLFGLAVAGSSAYGLVAQGADGLGLVTGSVLSGQNGSAAVFGPALIKIATSEVSGAPNNSGGTITCVGDFNGSFVALNTSCL
jgi:hypothetical protein